MSAEQNEYKIFISIPCYDAMITMQTMNSVMYLQQLLIQMNIQFIVDFIGNESLIPRARNTSLSRFKNSDCTHMLCIDSDIEFPAKAVLDLIKFNKEVVCCAYPRKSYNWKRFMYSMSQEQDSGESLDSRGLDFTYNAMIDGKGKVIELDNFIQVKHASTGFMLIQRKIVDVLWEKHKELEIITDEMESVDKTIVGLFCCMIKDKIYLSEDYSFCERVYDAGGSVWINTKHNLNHIGKHVFRSDIQNRKNKGRTQAERIFYK